MGSYTEKKILPSEERRHCCCFDRGREKKVDVMDLRVQKALVTHGHGGGGGCSADRTFQTIEARENNWQARSIIGFAACSIIRSFFTTTAKTDGKFKVKVSREGIFQKCIRR